MGCSYTYPGDLQPGRLDQVALALADLKAQNERLHRELLEVKQAGRVDVLKLDVACQTLTRSNATLQAEISAQTAEVLRAHVGTQAVESFAEPVKANVGIQVGDSSGSFGYDTDLILRRLLWAREIQSEKSSPAVNVQVAPAAAPASSSTLAGAALGLAAATAGAYFTQKSTPSPAIRATPFIPEFHGIHERGLGVEAGAEDHESREVGRDVSNSQLFGSGEFDRQGEIDGGGEAELREGLGGKLGRGYNGKGHENGESGIKVEGDGGDGRRGSDAVEIGEAAHLGGKPEVLAEQSDITTDHTSMSQHTPDSSRSRSGLGKHTLLLRRESSCQSMGSSPKATKTATVGKAFHVKAVSKSRGSCIGLPTFVAAHDFADCTGVGRKKNLNQPEIKASRHLMLPCGHSQRLPQSPGCLRKQ
eukprot:TRINITY_DN14397_c0_g2_i1.p1 TRINITY_DN14397_c0_g2~~TRINITY_DN14397_c0_g2_i1.p1  ORF type:complete len:418 (-),score=53.27 TRINITY_DN14397_c0_g2_i1:668-1921(-)